MGGVLASDQLPSVKPSKREMKRKYLFYIVNLDPSDKPGSHWVLCFLRKFASDIYFDSYGFPPVVDDIKDFMGEDFLYNDKQVQYPLSSSCGQWCLFVAWHQVLNFNLESIGERFGKDLLKNDVEINVWLNSVFNKQLKVIDTEFLLRQLARTQLENKVELPHIYDAH